MPRFSISANDCAVLPAEFLPNTSEPVAAARNGTIYGQAFLNPGAGRGIATVELHYFHLWSEDCGHMSHRLDAERVSVLIAADSARSPLSAWRALYWYASAHEDTMCDATHGVRADSIGASDRGADVWISHGKHASYLNRELCNQGCGGDRCEAAMVLAVPRIVNLGEPGMPMNGALWAASAAWGLAGKMGASFDEAVTAKLAVARGTEPVPFNNGNRVVKKAAHLGVSAADGAASGADRTDEALEEGDRRTDRAARKASESGGNAVTRGVRETRKSVIKARRRVLESLGVNNDDPDKKKQ